ncbi:hypothetical protein MM_1065 [Methanosarcina mazei Go1]|uniref:Uncharacterized protein n=1 Tax=Methanosarcina mazei (strain ATCC BAA-159 / DSM 3647 / Goe1 / Go1 / JCM 11833 / OCM 88) TaxID=192952 RepID=Q8PY01_METMA|nr:hypothetical protein MM_1065 [Methanosarcina mazei Go1]
MIRTRLHHTRLLKKFSLQASGVERFSPIVFYSSCFLFQLFSIPIVFYSNCFLFQLFSIPIVFYSDYLSYQLFTVFYFLCFYNLTPEAIQTNKLIQKSAFIEIVRKKFLWRVKFC